jgi:hypothetical protein
MNLEKLTATHKKVFVLARLSNIETLRRVYASSYTVA